jgi:hypothetical protein
LRLRANLTSGPVLDLATLEAVKHRKLVYLPKDLLEKLYARFALANPKGTRIVAGSQFEDYAPPGLTRVDKDRLYEEGKMFANILGDIAGEPRLRELLPELDDPAVLERRAADPALDFKLMARANLEGALSRGIRPPPGHGGAFTSKGSGFSIQVMMLWNGRFTPPASDRLQIGRPTSRFSGSCCLQCLPASLNVLRYRGKTPFRPLTVRRRSNPLLASPKLTWGSYDSDPFVIARWPGDPNGKWSQGNIAELAHEGRPLSKASFDRMFPSLPPLPSALSHSSDKPSSSSRSSRAAPDRSPTPSKQQPSEPARREGEQPTP